MKYPAYIIHHSSCVEREPLVKDLVEKTGGVVIPALFLQDRNAGCTKSHHAVAWIAKQQYPDSPYLVFEDDCVLEDNWEEALEFFEKSHHFDDIVYLGYNDQCEKTVFGTHALLMTPKARDILLEKQEMFMKIVEVKNANDWILSALCRHYNLKFSLPIPKNRWCHQKTGLRSTITGNIRSD